MFVIYYKLVQWHFVNLLLVSCQQALWRANVCHLAPVTQVLASAGRIWAIYYKSLTWIKAFSLYWRPAPMSKSEPMRTVSRSKKGLPVFGHPTCLNKKCQRNIFTMNGSCCHIRVSMFLSKTSYSNHRPRVFKIDFSQGVLEKVSSSCRHSKASGHF